MVRTQICVTDVACTKMCATSLQRSPCAAVVASCSPYVFTAIMRCSGRRCLAVTNACVFEDRVLFGAVVVTSVSCSIHGTR
jgi:hypothetical protein